MEREVIERYYILDEPLGEIACGSDKSYYQFARVKKMALKKLKFLLSIEAEKPKAQSAKLKGKFYPREHNVSIKKY